MSICIVDATADAEPRGLFMALPKSVYRGDPNYCIPSPRAVVAALRREVFEGAQRILVAVEDGRPSARVVARRSPSLRDDDGRPIGTLGFFEALDRPRPVRDLFEAAVSWLREAGVGRVVGPMDGDTWHRYRMSVGPFELPPFLLEPYNPPYYQGLWEQSGFKGIETYFSKRLDDIYSLVRRLEKKHTRATSKGYTLRPMAMRDSRSELALIYGISKEIFAGNSLYSDITLDDFLALYGKTKSLLDADLISIAHAPDGAPAGFFFAYPDRFRAVAAMRGGRGPLALLRFWLRKGRERVVNFKTLGVVPGHRRKGVDAALTYCVSQKAIEKGYEAANLCLIREGNRSGALAYKLGAVMRRYVLYEYVGRTR